MKNPRHVLAALSYYDQEYLRHYTGLNSLPIYSSSRLYTQGVLYKPTRPEILTMGYVVTVPTITSSKFQFIFYKQKYKHFGLSDLVSHKAIVFFPYAAMTYKLTEMYALGIPLFMPSMKYLRNNGGLGPDRSTLSEVYCNKPDIDKYMKPHHASLHPYSPNKMNDAVAEFYWLQMTDFFMWPHITYFDNFTDLENKLESADLMKIHHLMMEENNRKFKTLLDVVCEATNVIEDGYIVPQDYNLAIQALYNTTRLQYY
jgi:hypothetical protein